MQVDTSAYHDTLGSDTVSIHIYTHLSHIDTYTEYPDM